MSIIKLEKMKVNHYLVSAADEAVAYRIEAVALIYWILVVCLKFIKSNDLWKGNFFKKR